MMVESILLGD